MSYDEVVFKRSYLNLILLNAAIPSIKPLEEESEQEQQQADGDGFTYEQESNQRTPIGKTKYRNMDELFMSLM
jgi:hypothetical protein